MTSEGLALPVSKGSHTCIGACIRTTITNIDSAKLILLFFVRIRRTSSFEFLDLSGDVGLALGMSEFLSLVFEGLRFPVL